MTRGRKGVDALGVVAVVADADGALLGGVLVELLPEGDLGAGVGDVAAGLAVDESGAVARRQDLAPVGRGADVDAVDARGVGLAAGLRGELETLGRISGRGGLLVARPKLCGVFGAACGDRVGEFGVDDAALAGARLLALGDLLKILEMNGQPMGGLLGR